MMRELASQAGSFQSTHPVRGATDWDETRAGHHGYFNPRTP